MARIGRPPLPPGQRKPMFGQGTRKKLEREAKEAAELGVSVRVGGDSLNSTAKEVTAAEKREAKKIIARVMRQVGPCPDNPQEGIEWGSRLVMLAIRAAYSTTNLIAWRWADHVGGAVGNLGKAGNKWKYEATIMRLLAEYDRAKDQRTPIKYENDVKRPPGSRGATPRGPRPVQ